MQAPVILVTGATGYIGGRLVRRLAESGQTVRALARDPARLKDRVPAGVEICAGDVLDPSTLGPALRDVQTVYYLVHAMGAGADFEERDRRSAAHMAEAAKAAGVARIIYLGGLGDDDEELSPHLHSRHEVGRVLARTGVPVIEIRASIVIGSGSLSFEMIRALVERLPFMITPRWVETKAQPIGIRDLLAYLMAASQMDRPGHTIVEVGAPEALSYGDLMREYARQRGLRRCLVPVPVLTPRLSSLWLRLVTPLYARVGRILVDSLVHPTLVRSDTAARLFPDIRPRSCRDAITDALRNEEMEFAETRWSDALSSAGATPVLSRERLGNRLVYRRSIHIDAPPDRAFEPVRRIGGRQGWYYANGLWALRGWMDLLVGGPGLRRGRRHDRELVCGDVLDCWRVEMIEPDRLRLFAEMKMPGRAWLEFRVTPEPGGSRLEQVAMFDPRGLSGLAYWYSVYPLHELVFAGMLRAMARAASGDR